MEQSLVILKATNKDVDALCKLVNSAYRGESSKAGWTTEADLLDGQRIDNEQLLEMLTDSSSCILKAVYQNELVACVYLKKNQDDCYLGMLTVKPVLQNINIGKKLLLAAEHHAIHVLKCQSMSMTVITTRVELLAWYKRRGYELTSEKRDFPMGDPRFGIPKVNKIEFNVLRKVL